MNTQKNAYDFERKTFLLKEDCSADDLVKNHDEDVLADEIAAVLASGDGTSKELSIAKSIVLRFAMLHDINCEDEKYSGWIAFLELILENESNQ